MAIDPRIAMGVKSLELPAPTNNLAQYAQMQQIQSGQRQGEAAQMQIETLRRDRDALAKMQEAITAKGGPPNLRDAATAMYNSGIPEYVKQSLTIFQSLDKQDRFANLLNPGGGDQPTGAAPQPQAAPSEPYPGYNEEIGMGAPANALAPVSAAPQAAPVNAMAQQPSGDMRAQINQAYASGTPEALAWAKAREAEMKPTVVSAGSSVFSGGQFGATAPAQTPTKVAEYEFAKTPQGGGYRGSYQQFIQQQATAGRAAATPSAPVSVIGPNGKPILVTREQSFGMTPAGELPKLAKDFQWDETRQTQTLIPGSPSDKKMRGAVAKEIANKKVVNDTLNLELANIDKLIGNEAGTTAQHKGLSGVFGTVASRLPTFRQDVGNAEELVDSLASKASINSLLTIRGQGSAIGSITEREWPRLEGMKAALGKKQSPEAYKQNLRDYRAELLRMKGATDQAVLDAQTGLDEVSPSQRQPKAGGADIESLLNKYK